MNKRGNPNWCKSLQPIPALLTEFEVEVECLGLVQPEYIASAELRRWCDSNRNRVYVPEWLLAELEMNVDLNLGAA